MTGPSPKHWHPLPIPKASCPTARTKMGVFLSPSFTILQRQPPLKAGHPGTPLGSYVIELAGDFLSGNIFLCVPLSFFKLTALFSKA